MVASNIQAGNGGQSSFRGKSRALRSISRAVALATLLVAGAGVAQAADSNDRIIPPNPADVAMLRSLLALQHPTLRQGGSTTSATGTSVPTTVTDPSQQSGQTS